MLPQLAAAIWFMSSSHGKESPVRFPLAHQHESVCVAHSKQQHPPAIEQPLTVRIAAFLELKRLILRPSNMHRNLSTGPQTLFKGLIKGPTFKKLLGTWLLNPVQETTQQSRNS